MILPDIDPIAFQIGPMIIRWYSLSWMAAFTGIYFLAKSRLTILSLEQLSDLMFYGLLGAMLGGRIGYMLFYSVDQLLADPVSLFRVWEGGLSFHGGFLGVIVSIYYLSRSWGIRIFEILDFIAPNIPLGLGTVRIGNFLNSELLGRPTDQSWGFIFPSDPTGLMRHPSQLYQAFAEGLVLLFFLLWVARKPKPHMAISAYFLIGYGSLRTITEFYRAPDAHIGFDLFDFFTRGQLLSIPMALIGIMLLILSYYNRNHERVS
jgi:phosphatidylglycerol:prolipoprotein diacylglycerol transferase